MTYQLDYFTCDGCGRRERDDEVTEGDPQGWILTMMDEDLCPECQDKR